MSSIKKINQIAKVRRGASPRPIDDPKYFGGGVGWVRIMDVSASKKYLKKTTQYLSKIGESHSVRVDKGDLVMSIAGTVGKPIIIDIPACIHDGFVQIYNYDREETETEYLYYQLQYIEDNIKSLGQSGTQTNINSSLVGGLSIYHPDFKIQQKITEILRSIDDNIDLTESIIEKHEKIKVGLMQDLLSKGVDSKGNIRSFETHEFKDSPIGKIPKEWKVSSTEKELYMKGRIGWQGLKKDEFLEHGNYLVTGIHFTDDYKIDWDSCFRISDLRYEQAPEIQLKKGDLLITKDGTIGKLAFIDLLPGKASLNSHLLVLRPYNNNLKPRYLFYELLTERFKRFVDNIKTGSTLVGLSQSNFGKYLFAIPETDEQETIISILDECLKTIESNKEYHAKLLKVKKGLMQDLLSGSRDIIL